MKFPPICLPTDHAVRRDGTLNPAATAAAFRLAC
jgi:hypothetical protein